MIDINRLAVMNAWSYVACCKLVAQAYAFSEPSRDNNASVSMIGILLKEISRIKLIPEIKLPIIDFRGYIFRVVEKKRSNPFSPEYKAYTWVMKYLDEFIISKC